MSLGASAVEHQLAELLIQHERLQRSHNALLATMRSQTETYIQHTLENATCVVPDHPETPANATLLSAMCVVVTAIIIVTIAFEWLKEEWEKRMHQSLKAVVRNVFGELTILGFIGLVMFLTTKLGKDKLDLLAYKWFNTTCFKSDLWCEDNERVLVCPENVLIGLTENIHMVLFLVMMIFMVETILVIRQGKRKMREWRLHEEFCLSNSLGVAAARVMLAADLFEQSSWWSCGIYDGKTRKWICGLYEKKHANAGIENQRKNGKYVTIQNNNSVSDQGGFHLNPVGSVDSGSREDGAHPAREQESQDYLEVAAHFGRIPERRVCICPCLHARHNYFEARSQLRYCAMRTGFINAHNARVMSDGHGDFHNLPQSFDFSEYISHILGEHLAEMVDVTPKNWLTLWLVFVLFMIVDFEDLLQLHTGGFVLAISSITVAYVSCLLLFCVRNHTIEVEHKLLNDKFLRFHITHGVCGRLICSCCFSARKIQEAHRSAIRDGLFHMDAHADSKTRPQRKMEGIGKMSGSDEGLTSPLLASIAAEKTGAIERKGNSSNSSRQPAHRIPENASANKESFGPVDTVTVDRLHEFDTHANDFDRTSHRPRYRWNFDEVLGEWQETPLKSNLNCCKRCIGHRETSATHHERLFWFGSLHREFLYNYVRMSLLLIAVYVGVFSVEFARNTLSYYSVENHLGRTSNGTYSGDDPRFSYTFPVIIFVVAIVPVFIHDVLLPDIVAKLVQTTKIEQMIDTKHVQRVLAMMKAKKALMVLHNMGCFMQHIDDAANDAKEMAHKSVKNMVILADLTRAQKEELLSNCRPRTFLRNRRIVEQGQRSSSMFIVVQGKAKAYSDQSIETRIIETGQVFGEIAMINGEVSSETVVAYSSKCVCFEVTHEIAVDLLPEQTMKTLEERAKRALENGETKIQEIPSPVNRSNESHLGRSSPFAKKTAVKKSKHRHLKSAIEMLREHAMHSTYLAIDTDHSGSVDPQEMREFFVKLFPRHHPNHKFHMDQVNILAQEIDVDGDGEVSEKEFHNFMMPIIVKDESVTKPETSARRMFNIIDSMEESDGKVTTKKFKDMLELFGMPMSYEEVRELFHEYDEDFDGYLDEEEFTLMMMDTGIED